MNDQPTGTVPSRSRAKVFTCTFCRKFVIESHDRECCTRTLCAKCHEKLDIVDCHLNCYDWDYLFRDPLHAQGIDQFESIRTNAPREPSATESYHDGIVVPGTSLVPTETLIARAAEMFASRSNPFLPPTAIRRLHGWMKASLLENIREYAPPLLGVPYVQLIYDSHSFPGTYEEDSGWYVRSIKVELQEIRAAVEHCLPHRDILRGYHLAVRCFVQDEYLRRTKQDDKMAKVIRSFLLTDEWWDSTYIPEDRPTSGGAQIHEAMRTCLADPNCRHILVASWKTPCGVYFEDLNQPEADAKITFTHCLLGFIPVNHYWERLDPHRGAPYITTTEFNRCYMSTFVDFTDTEEDMDTFHDTPDSEEVTKVKERFTQPFPACEVGTKCMRFACPFSHVCHTTGCRELLDQRPCPSGFGAEQHHDDEMGSSMEWGSWDRADSISTR